MKKIEFSQEQIEDILNKYQDNWSQQKIADFYQVSRTVIKRILETQYEGLVIRDKTSKYKYQQDIFEKIDTAEKAYWLGFLAADGCNYQREHNASIIINVHIKDVEHLEKFKQFCNTDAQIKSYIGYESFSNQTPMCKITLNSKKISNDLIEKGILPNKSLILQPPNISKEFYKPFILGYFDGDGSISKTSQYNNYSISIQGTKELLTWICDELKWNTKLEKRDMNSTKNSYYIRCGGTNKPYLILKQLYDTCDVHLDRKFNIYKALETVVLSRNTERLLDRELLESP